MTVTVWTTEEPSMTNRVGSAAIKTFWLFLKSCMKNVAEMSTAIKPFVTQKQKQDNWGLNTVTSQQGGGGFLGAVFIKFAGCPWDNKLLLEDSEDSPDPVQPASCKQ